MAIVGEAAGPVRALQDADLRADSLTVLKDVFLRGRR